MLLRAYTTADASATFDVFTRAIRQTASQDYTPEQVNAWAHDRKLLDWDRDRATATTQVAELHGALVGFTDVDSDGHIDMLYVDPEYERRGIASILMSWVIETANAAGIVALTTHASITARPFFETHGFAVVEECQPVIHGVEFTNYLMKLVIHLDGCIPSITR